ncbi:hypothetical protein E2562_014767 [Oryza meyeriana var. granulata]|uniref:Uncharacterized protein n=1 Tax=Oryza meyeriana var. granulata TaxID=110450 RepID=A0A6G1BKV9_9ORYZ|nr:hypothetical protein E2562_014767 [Oryza meyeriana var. granulata]
MLPEDAKLPGNFYKCKKVVEALGMPVQKIDRLYMSKKTSAQMTYHKDGLESEKRNNQSNKKKLAHPANSKAWKHFNKKYSDFAKEPRNLWTEGVVTYDRSKNQNFVMKAALMGTAAKDETIESQVRALSIGPRQMSVSWYY